MWASALNFLQSYLNFCRQGYRHVDFGSEVSAESINFCRRGYRHVRFGSEVSAESFLQTGRGPVSSVSKVSAGSLFLQTGLQACGFRFLSFCRVGQILADRVRACGFRLLSFCRVT